MPPPGLPLSRYAKNAASRPFSTVFLRAPVLRLRTKSAVGLTPPSVGASSTLSDGHSRTGLTATFFMQLLILRDAWVSTPRCAASPTLLFLTTRHGHLGLLYLAGDNV